METFGGDRLGDLTRHMLNILFAFENRLYGVAVMRLCICVSHMQGYADVIEEGQLSKKGGLVAKSRVQSAVEILLSRRAINVGCQSSFSLSQLVSVTVCMRLT